MQAGLICNLGGIFRRPGWVHLAPFLIVALAGLLRVVSFLPDDVSWMLNLAERIWHGERPYIDFFDSDLPAAIFVYMPAVVLEQVTGIDALLLVNIMTIAAGCGTVWFSLRLLMQHGVIAPGRGRMAAAVALFVLLVLPGNTFAQRDALAAMALVPLLSLYVVRAAGEKPHWLASLAAGALAGLAIAIKPYFAPAVLFCALYLAFLDPSRFWSRVFSLENLFAAALLLLYAVAIFALLPGFIANALPADLIVYGPSRMSTPRLLRNEATIAIVLSASAMVLAAGNGLHKPPFAIPAVAGAGFALAFLVQAKCFPYHAYAAIAVFVLVGLAGLLAAPRRDRRFFSAAVALGVAIGLSYHNFGLPLVYPAIFHAARAVAPAHPKVTAVAGPVIGAQIARYLDGTWLLRAPSQFLTRRAEGLLKEPGLSPERRRRITELANRDVDILLDSFRGRPDLVIVDVEGRTWAARQPAVRRALEAYRPAAAAGEYTLWTRR